jgi:hypothetical protein
MSVSTVLADMPQIARSQLMDATATAKKVQVETPAKAGPEPMSHFAQPALLIVGLVAIIWWLSSVGGQPTVANTPSLPVASQPSDQPQKALTSGTNSHGNSGIHVQGDNNTVTIETAPPRYVERIVERPVIVERYVSQSQPQTQTKETVIEKTVIVGPSLVVVKPTEASQHTVLTTDPLWAQKHAEHIRATNDWKAMFNRR